MIIAAVMIVVPLAVVAIKNSGNAVKESPIRSIETIAKSLRKKNIYVELIKRVQKKGRSK